jgi:DNA-binding XRE family transcriptional regulator
VKDFQLVYEMRWDKRLTIDEVAGVMGISREDYLSIERGENSRGAKQAQDAILKMPPRWDRPAEPRNETGILKG